MRIRRLIGVFVLVGAAAAAVVGWSPPQRPSAAETPHPNIVLILTDDQRWDTSWSMPIVQRKLVERGVTFDQSFVSNPLCCPSRSAILTGELSHSTLVYRQSPPFGRWDWFRDRSTIATWLDDAGRDLVLASSGNRGGRWRVLGWNARRRTCSMRPRSGNSWRTGTPA